MLFKSTTKMKIDLSGQAQMLYFIGLDDKGDTFQI